MKRLKNFAALFASTANATSPLQPLGMRGLYQEDDHAPNS